MTEFSGQEVELRDFRRKLLHTLVSRAWNLFISQPPPASYFVGQEYVEDARRLPCRIVLAFIFPGLIKPIEFWHRKSRIVIQNKQPILTIEINRKISERLWDDLRWFRRGQRFIIGYINTLMPAINRQLLDNRYLTAQPMSRTFFLLEAYRIWVACKNDTVQLNWPVSTSLIFTRSEQLALGRTQSYLIHFVDAIHAFLKNDYDDCIRRLVTSTENFFTFRGWRATSGPNTFRRILDDNVRTDLLSGQVIIENLKFVYHIRNKIVHHGFRMSTSSGLFCDKAIATLRYLIQRYSGDKSMAQYAYSLGMQLLALQEVLGHNLCDLDDIEQRRWSVPNGISPIITNRSELEQFMFTALRFTAQDKSSIV